MKLDSDQALSHGTISHKLESKAFEQNDNDLESTGVKSRDGILKESQKVVLCDSKVCEDDGNQLPHSMNAAEGWTSPKLDCSMNLDDLSCRNEMTSRDFVEPITSTQSSTKMEAFERDSVFYMDKNVMERELPELIVCYKDNTYHVVKDICIDEGVPSQDKFLFDTDVHEKSVCTFLSPEKDINSESVKERVNADLPIPDVMKSLPQKENPDALNHSTDKESRNKFSLDNDLMDVMTTGEVTDYATKKTGSKESKEVSSLGDLLWPPEMGTHVSHMKASVNGMDEVEQQYLQKPSDNAILVTAPASGESEIGSEGRLARLPLGSAAEKSHEEVIAAGSSLDSADNEKSVLENPFLISTTEESDNRQEKSAIHLDSVLEESMDHDMDEPSYNSKVETRSITFDFDASAPSSSGREEFLQIADREHLGMQTLSRHADHSIEPSLNRLQYVPGETSFSASGPSSGRISYSGPIPFSGNLSIRSDSSTTSTRSFAFPVLQNEWNSSPVRMAKADRRHLRKHRSWLACCKF